MADSTSGGVSGRGKHKHLCGVPPEMCGGSIAILSAGFKGKSLKAHNSPSEAFNCYGRYLTKLGYIKLSSREYKEPDGPIHVLTKKSRFGGHLRPGKSNRNQPAGRRLGGICISK